MLVVVLGLRCDSGVAPLTSANGLFDQVSPIKSLNHPPWQGGDGPMLGSAIHVSGVDLARLAQSMAPLVESVGPASVRSQIGRVTGSSDSVIVAVTRLR